MADQQSFDPADPAYRTRIADPKTRARADLIDIGFATAGSVYNSKNDPNVSAAWRQAGGNISGVLQERWFRKEFESFQDMYLQPYVERLRGLDGDLVEKFGQLDTMGQVMNPDGTLGKLDPNGPEAEELKKKWLSANVQELARATDDLMSAAIKYGNGNPLIDVRLNQIMGSHAEVIGQITNPAQFMAGQMSEAQLATERQQPGYVAAQAERQRAAGRKDDRTDPNLRAGGGANDRDPTGTSPIAYKNQWGIPETISLMMSDKDPWGAKSYLVAEEQRATNEIIERAKAAHAKGVKGVEEKTGIAADGTIARPEKFQAVLGQSAGKIKIQGAIAAARALFPGDVAVEEYMKGMYPQHFKQPGEEPQAEPGRNVHIPAVLTRKEQKSYLQDIENVGYEAVDKAFRTGKIKKGTPQKEMERQAAEIARDAIDAAVTAEQGNPEAAALADEMAQKALETVTSNWTRKSAVGRTVSGKPSLSERFSEIMEDPDAGAIMSGQKAQKARRSSAGIL